ncbi:MAG TPA: endonuclease/exonuclease/phosphatase family protein [Williamwhitmania sp.]|nr:endonuclease/exonuclease/phosphatase family protein [Williamwhitmania sp.]
MKKLYIKWLPLVATFVLFLAIQTQAQEKQYRVGCIAFYNQENFYDTIQDPTINDHDFLPNGPYHWNTERYQTKLDHMSTVISQIGSELFPGGPAIIGISEIENRQVVEDLVNTPKLKASGYQFVHYESPDSRGIDVALLYRPAFFKVTNTRSVRLVMKDNPDFKTRDQLVVSGIYDGEPLHIIVNHWPSRFGGEKKSLPNRKAAAELTKSLADSILAIDPNAKIIIMGDLNDDPTSPSLIKTLGAKGERQDVGPKDFFNTMYQLFKEGNGSLAYHDTWNLFDQIIISEPLLNAKPGTYKFLKAKIFKADFITQQDGQFKGYPLRTYVGTTYQGGYSDHFPTYIFIAKEIIK